MKQRCANRQDDGCVMIYGFLCLRYHSCYYQISRVATMQAKKKRLTLDMDPAFQRRLKATAALKGVSMRQYCLSAIEGELDKDGVNNVDAESETVSTFKDQSVGFDIDGLKALRQEIFGDRVLPGNSADLLREARAIRDAELEAATTGKKPPEHFGMEALIALRDGIFGDKILPGNSADLLREAREIRNTQLDAHDRGTEVTDTPMADRFEALQKEVFADKVLPGSSVELIREAREIRDAQMDRW